MYGINNKQLLQFDLQRDSAHAAGSAVSRSVKPNAVALADFDRAFHGALAAMTGGISPDALLLAFVDWGLHLAGSPGRQVQLALEALQGVGHLLEAAACSAVPGHQPWELIKPQAEDHRFAHAGWSLQPYNFAAQTFLLSEAWWRSATTGVRGVSQHHEAVVAFVVRQLLDTVAPSNSPFGNPAVIEQAKKTGGSNFLDGYQNWLADLARLLSDRRSEASEFPVGKAVAASPGKVVYRNELIELIQYTPTTETVRPEPILIVPAWIMKYYILDLTPEHSLVKYLTDSGYTVFMISWHNPTSADRDLSLEDYREKGVDAAINILGLIKPRQPVHAVGYCLGGTLLSIAAAAMGRDGLDRLKTVTLLAAQTGFTEAGELTLFVNDSQVAFLEDMMWRCGLLETSQMAGAFQILRSNDLIWSRIVREYLMGEREHGNDLMAWNADATRMPYRMHSDYLRRLFLNNDLAEGRYRVGGKPIALSDLRKPIFAVGTVHDHIAPWKSVYKINFLADADTTFVLASGGHNAGIVAPLTASGRFYQVLPKTADAPYVGPDDWAKRAPRHEGSWWPEWVRWLNVHSGEPCEPPRMGTPINPGPDLGDAPGQYVHER